MIKKKMVNLNSGKLMVEEHKAFSIREFFILSTMAPSLKPYSGC